MTSIIVSDPISSFPRDQVPFVLRLTRSTDDKSEIGKVLINKDYPFALIKFLDKNFDRNDLYKSENGTFKIFIPEWLNL